MIPYDHAPALPRDFKSELIVQRRWETKHEDVRRKTSLNDPLLERTPFPGLTKACLRSSTRSVGRSARSHQRSTSSVRLDGIRRDGCRRLPPPRPDNSSDRLRAYTILGVGNNPGIYIIAAGSIMMSVGNSLGVLHQAMDHASSKEADSGTTRSRDLQAKRARKASEAESARIARCLMIGQQQRV